jgi:hypothetical protein
MSDTDDTKAMLQKFREQQVLRKTTSDSGERMRITRELTDLEAQIRAAVKANPVPEPLGTPLLNKVADKMTELGFGIFANRLRGQHLRHPTYVPFENLDQLRDYLSAHLDDATLAKIPEFAAKKKRFGLF